MTTLFGIGYRRRYRDELLSLPPRPNFVLEIMASHFFTAPESVLPLAERFPIVIHDVMGSLGTAHTTAIDRTLLAQFRKIVSLTRPMHFAEHLSFTRSPSGTDVGHLCPLWLTRESLRLIADRVRALQDALGVPILLENIAWPFVVPDADFTEAAFFHELSARCDVGLLLDLSNHIANAKNFGFDARKRLREYPLDRVAQVHLAGSHLHKGFWVDSHDSPVDDSSYDLLGELTRSPLRAVIIERDGRLPAIGELFGEVDRARTALESNKRIPIADMLADRTR